MCASLRAFGFVVAAVPLLNGLIRFTPVDSLIPTIPVDKWPDGGFTMFPRLFVSTLAAVLSAFVMVWTRGRVGGAGAAARWLITGIVLLIVYFVGCQLVVDDVYWKLGWARDHPGRLVGDVVLLAAYCGGFALMTLAFAVLGHR